MTESRRAIRGLTLIEILAVLVIIGVVTAVAVLSVQALGGRSDQGQAAIKLAGLIQLASEDARLENVQYGLRTAPHEYQFMRYQNGAWAQVTGDVALKPHRLPAGLTLTVSVQNPIRMPSPATGSGTAAVAAAAAASAAAPTTSGGSSGDTQTVTPQIAILSTGEITPFTAHLSSPDGTVFLLRSSGNGKIHVVPPQSSASPATAD